VTIKVGLTNVGNQAKPLEYSEKKSWSTYQFVHQNIECNFFLVAVDKCSMRICFSLNMAVENLGKNASRKT
jgi:hypothetical protein